MGRFHSTLLGHGPKIQRRNRASIIFAMGPGPGPRIKIGSVIGFPDGLLVAFRELVARFCVMKQRVAIHSYIPLVRDLKEYMLY